MATDRNGLAVLTTIECIRLLSTHIPRVGRLAFVADDKPVILPLNFMFYEGTIVFRTGRGAKLSAASQGQDVAFEIDAIDPLWEEGWSVLVRGRAEEVRDTDELKRMQTLPLRPWAPGAKAGYVRIATTEISGRRID